MTTQEFKYHRERYIANQAPHLVTTLSALEVIGENHFSINGVDFSTTENVSNCLDKIIGMGDAKLVKNISGETGLKNARNYFSTAKSVEKDKKIVLIANANDKTVTDLKPLKKDYIAVEAFFDFLEFFANEFNFEIEKLHVSSSIVGGATAYLKSVHPTYTKVIEGEEFIDNGLFVDWDTSELEMGSYFTRLVCVNGSIQRIKSKQVKINSFAENNVQQLIKTINDKVLMRNSFESYARQINERAVITASMRELKEAVMHLDTAGVDENNIENLVPYNALKEEFEFKGIDINYKEKIAKSNLTLWELYNKLTEFATYTDLWQEDDIRRVRLIEFSNRFLYKKPDINLYLEAI